MVCADGGGSPVSPFVMLDRRVVGLGEELMDGAVGAILYRDKLATRVQRN